MIYTLLATAGKGAAANPNLSMGGSGGLGLNNIDPVGNWITSIGGDPLNLYGNKNNPGALFFPGPSGSSANAGSGGPVQLPMTGGNAGLLSAYSTFLNNLGAPPMQAPPSGAAPAGGASMRGGGGMDYGGMSSGRPMVSGGAGAGYPGMAALSRLNFMLPQSQGVPDVGV